MPRCLTPPSEDPMEVRTRCPNRETFGSEGSTPEIRPQRIQLATELANLGSENSELRSKVVTIIGQRANSDQIVDSFRLSPPAGPQTNALTRTRIAS